VVLLYNILYNRFPRQVSLPKRATVNKYDFYRIINQYNGKVRIFSSVYNYTGESSNIALDKIFFDFDGDSAIDNLKAMVDYLVEKDIKFLPLFSGGGFHVYVFTKNYEYVTNKKTCLLNAHHHIKHQAQIQFDTAIIGDLARVATVPNTWNNKRERFCIPVSLDDISKGYDYISERAKIQQFSYCLYGTKLFDIEPFDTFENQYNIQLVEIDEDVRGLIDSDKILKELPPCISGMLANGNTKRVGYRGRYLIITYLRDKGVVPNDTKDILEKYLTTVKKGKTEAKHCIEDERQVNYLYFQNTDTFPFCETLKREGYCPDKQYCNESQKYDDLHLVKIYR
jgi:hypothetical protein